jgi:hypothetical protein
MFKPAAVETVNRDGCMTLDEFQRLQVGDPVMVHYARRGDQLLAGTVISQGRFAVPIGVHVGVKLLATGETVYPPCGRVHRSPMAAAESCRFCTAPGRVGR